MAQELRKRAPALPATVKELREYRHLKVKRTINDLVEDFVVRLWEDKTFSKLVEAVYDSEAVEGSLDIDDVMAAQYIRATASKTGNKEVGEAKLDTIRLAMRTVLRRYRQSRAERRDGARYDPPTPVPIEDNNEEEE